MNIVDTLRDKTAPTKEDYDDLFYFAERASVLAATLFSVMETLEIEGDRLYDEESVTPSEIAALRRELERAVTSTDALFDILDPARDIRECGDKLIPVAKARGGLPKI